MNGIVFEASNQSSRHRDGSRCEDVDSVVLLLPVALYLSRPSWRGEKLFT